MVTIKLATDILFRTGCATALTATSAYAFNSKPKAAAAATFVGGVAAEIIHAVGKATEQNETHVAIVGLFANVTLGMYAGKKVDETYTLGDHFLNALGAGFIGSLFPNKT